MNDASTSAKARVRSIQAIDERLISELRPYAGNARTHSKRQIRQIMDSISRFGFTNPVLIGDDDGIVDTDSSRANSNASLQQPNKTLFE